MTFEVVWGVARVLLRRQVLASDSDDGKAVVIAGHGTLVVRDKATRRLRISGHGLDPFEVARLYVDRVGAERALRSARVREHLRAARTR